jgi:hypothetical protein
VDFVEQMSLNNQKLQQKANAPFAAQSWQSKNNRMKEQRKMRTHKPFDRCGHRNLTPLQQLHNVATLSKIVREKSVRLSDGSLMRELQKIESLMNPQVRRGM